MPEPSTIIFNQCGVFSVRVLIFIYVDILSLLGYTFKILVGVTLTVLFGKIVCSRCHFQCIFWTSVPRSETGVWLGMIHEYCSSLLSKRRSHTCERSVPRPATENTDSFLFSVLHFQCTSARVYPLLAKWINMFWLRSTNVQNRIYVFDKPIWLRAKDSRKMSFPFLPPHICMLIGGPLASP